MKLQAWLDEKELGYVSASRLFGASNAGVVYNWAIGKAVPRPATIATIYVVTKGKVRPEDFYDLPSFKPQQQQPRRRRNDAGRRRRQLNADDDQP